MAQPDIKFCCTLRVVLRCIYLGGFKPSGEFLGHQNQEIYITAR